VLTVYVCLLVVVMGLNGVGLLVSGYWLWLLMLRASCYIIYALILGNLFIAAWTIGVDWVLCVVIVVWFTWYELSVRLIFNLVYWWGGVS